MALEELEAPTAPISIWLCGCGIMFGCAGGGTAGFALRLRTMANKTRRSTTTPPAPAPTAMMTVEPDGGGGDGGGDGSAEHGTYTPPR